MPYINNPSYKNEQIVLSEYIPPELYFNKHTIGDNVVITGTNLDLFFGETDCFTFGFIKISISSTVLFTLTIEWKPSHTFFSYDQLDFFDNPANMSYFSNGHKNLEKTLLITPKTETYTIAKNTYRYLILPIQGERIKLTGRIDITDAESQEGNGGIMVRCCLSNNYHNVINS
tara:strand:+ start:705 stop:1223 length:519 start_codon:yes stop_codon:yes gene_type:complete